MCKITPSLCLENQKWSSESALDQVSCQGVQGTGVSSLAPGGRGVPFWDNSPWLLTETSSWPGQGFSPAGLVGTIRGWSRQAVDTPRVVSHVGIVPKPHAVCRVPTGEFCIRGRQFSGWEYSREGLSH